MRPRRRRRGEPSLYVKVWVNALAYDILQCGHGGDAVENLGEAVVGLPRSRPSMRPRRRRRGEQEVQAEGSLRWRPFNAATAATPWRTALPNRSSTRQASPLQCGHGGDAVENLSGW